jgi:hypothetical protein
MSRFAFPKTDIFSSTGFSLCGFDLWRAKVKRTQAEACATENRPALACIGGCFGR